jgi:Na+/H+ antiporter NhaD/arsenite permease-like protein
MPNSVGRPAIVFGIPSWTMGLLPEWLFANVIILAIFYLWDRRAYRKERKADITRDMAEAAPLDISGRLNIILMAGVVIVVALQIAAPYRELAMIALSLLSLAFTKKELRVINRFTFHPINEVAILFAGIFITMVPLLKMLHDNGAALGVTKPWQFFWATGLLSSILDNAPTYLTFFSLAQNVTGVMPNGVVDLIAGVHPDLLRAISCGAVFMGANTYIGNGPNFMVKAIAEEQGVKIPHFFGYMAYSGAILIPIFIAITFIFFHG